MPHRIGILQFVSQLDDVVEGFKQGLAELGYLEPEGVVYEYRNAQGSVPALDRLATELVSAGVDLIFASGTPSAQAANAAAGPGGIAVLFAPVFDPLGAGLVAALDVPGGRVTGVSGMVAASDRLGALRRIVPKLERVAFVFNPDDPNPRAELGGLEKQASRLEIRLERFEASSAEQLGEVGEDAMARNQAVLVSLDRLVDQNLGVLVDGAIAYKRALVAHNGEGVKKGALMALESNHSELGRMVARMAGRVFRGEDPGCIPVGFPEKPRLVLNPGTARRIGLKIPAELPDGTITVE